MKGDEWKSDTWDWLEMSKNISNDGIPGNLILEASVGPDLENTSENIIKVWGRCSMRSRKNKNEFNYFEMAFPIDWSCRSGT